MIVDLMRNDLGRVCAYGSVAAPREPTAEPHPGCGTWSRACRASCGPGVGNADLLRASFPPGSVTGAPKVQALKVIAALSRWPARSTPARSASAARWPDSSSTSPSGRWSCATAAYGWAPAAASSPTPTPGPSSRRRWPKPGPIAAAVGTRVTVEGQASKRDAA